MKSTQRNICIGVGAVLLFYSWEHFHDIFVVQYQLMKARNRAGGNTHIKIYELRGVDGLSSCYQLSLVQLSAVFTIYISSKMQIIFPLVFSLDSEAMILFLILVPSFWSRYMSIMRWLCAFRDPTINIWGSNVGNFPLGVGIGYLRFPYSLLVVIFLPSSKVKRTSQRMGPS